MAEPALEHGLEGVPASVEGPTVTGLTVIHSDTGWLAASKCCPRARTMSRSVKMPSSRSPSITRADPTRRSPMTVAASATDVDRFTARSCADIRSRTVAMGKPYSEAGSVSRPRSAVAAAARSSGSTAPANSSMARAEVSRPMPG